MITSIRLNSLCISLMSCVMLAPITAMARENLFAISGDSPVQIHQPQFAADIAQSTGRKKITLNDRLLSAAAGDELDFVTLSGTSYTVIFDRFSKGGKSKTWVGHLKDYGIQHRVMITVNNNTIEGRISTPEGLMNIKSLNGELILMDYKAEGMQAMPFGDDSRLPEAEALLPSADQPLSNEQNAITAAAAPSTVNGNTIVDVLVLYNDEFKARNNNPSTRIDYLTAVTNQAYLDSQISMQIRVVGTELISYSNSLTNDNLLDAISSYFLAGKVAALRNQTGADLVIFIRPYQYSHGSCGLAMLNIYMNLSGTFATVSDGSDINGSGYYCSDVSFAHELGHTMGLAHDKAHASYWGGRNPYSYGYGTQYQFGTIMSYTSPDVSLFSTPNLTSECLDYTCGSADADNARSLTKDKAAISGLRNEVISHTTDVDLNSMYLLLLH
ncbi:MAG: hypothetical protein GQ546_05485 [Gammaproteobacteria bacterium]|nr:hypothetical protein [Gammaproteobacteria bacterium]